jgi:hypothetical protein
LFCSKALCGRWTGWRLMEEALQQKRRAQIAQRFLSAQEISP